MTTGNEIENLRLDRLSEYIQEIKNDIKEIKCVLNKQSEVLAVNTQIVKEHERRSLALETEVKNQEKFQNRIWGAFIIIQILIPVFVKLFSAG